MTAACKEYIGSSQFIGSSLVVLQLSRRPPSMGAGTGEQGGQAPTLEKIRVGMAHRGNFSRGLKTSWQ